MELHSAKGRHKTMFARDMPQGSLGLIVGGGGMYTGYACLREGTRIYVLEVSDFYSPLDTDPLKVRLLKQGELLAV